MIESQWLSLLGTPFTIGFGIVLVLVVIALAWLAMSRSGFKRGIVSLEILRVLLAIMVAVTLNQPEWLQRFLPEEDPVLAVLWDDSQSMVTKDVFPQNDGEVQRPMTRSEWLQPWLSDEIWTRFGEKLKVVKLPFNSTADGAAATDINEALEQVAKENSNLRGVVLFSDGDWNIGKSPTVAATQLRLQKVPVYSVAVGSDEALPDLEVAALDAPTFGVVSKPTRIPFVINSTLPTTAVAEVVMTSSDGDQQSKTIKIRPNSRYEDALVWRPKRQGEYTLTLKLPNHESELNFDNNSLSVPISIRQESLKILIVESFPRWEYRYLRNALLRDPGVEVRTLLFHPKLDNVGGGLDYIDEFPTLEELSEFDVILLGDVGVEDGQLTFEDCRNIRGLVQNQATGLVFLPGFRGNQFSLLASELEALYPVQLDELQTGGWGSPVPAQLSLTEAGRLSLLTKLADKPDANASIWRSLPGFQWYAPVVRAKSGTQVLAVHATATNEDGRIPLLVTKTFGSGKILYLGTDGAWRWREGVEDKYHYRFWAQVARWMAYQRNMAGGDNMRLFYSPDRPKVNQTISLNANVTDKFGEPLRSGSVKVQVVAPSGDTQQVNLAPGLTGSEWGLFTGTLTPKEPGLHQAILTCRENSSTLETTITVIGDKREKIGKPVNSESLREVASITNGKLLSTDNFQDVFQELNLLPDPDPRVKRIRIWAHPIWAGSLVFLLGLFWVGRKLNGMV